VNSFHLARPTLPLLPRFATPIISPSVRLTSGMSVGCLVFGAAVSPAFWREARILRRNSFHLTVRSCWSVSWISVSCAKRSFTGSASEVLVSDGWASEALRRGLEISALEAVIGEADGEGLIAVEGRDPRTDSNVGERFSGVGVSAVMTVVLGLADGVCDKSSVGNVAFLR